MLRALGLARRLPKEEATAEALRATVLAVADDPEVAARCAAVKALMADEGGTKQAADLVGAALST